MRAFNTRPVGDLRSRHLGASTKRRRRRRCHGARTTEGPIGAKGRKLFGCVGPMALRTILCRVGLGAHDEAFKYGTAVCTLKFENGHLLSLPHDREDR